MKSLKIIVEKLKEKGIDQAEVTVVKLYEALQESLPVIVADSETSPVEKTVAGVVVPVLAGLKESVEKLADFDKDGQVG